MAPDAAAKAVVTFIGNADGIVFIFELYGYKHRAEYFFLCYAHLIVNVCKDSRLHKAPFCKFPVSYAVAAADNAGAFFFAYFNIVEYFIELPFVYL